MTEPTKTSFTGRARRRQTSRLVHWIDIIAQGTITIGGWMTIVAVLGVCLFLVWVVVPLFRPASVTHESQIKIADAVSARPLKVGVDEYQLMGWALYPDGMLDAFRLDDGSRILRRSIALTEGIDTKSDHKPPTMTAAAFSSQSDEILLGFSDGTARFGRIAFTTTYLDGDNEPADLAKLGEGETRAHEGGVAQRVSGRLRLQKIDVTLKEPIKVVDQTAVAAIDFVPGSSSSAFVVLGANGKLALESLTTRRNLLTGDETSETEESLLPFDRAQWGMPWRVALAGHGDNVFVIWRDGRLVRYDTRDSAKPMVAEEIDLTPEPDAKLTHAEFIIGRSTLVTGDTAGHVRAWFRIKPDGAPTVDGSQLVLAHELVGGGPAVASIAASTRSRLVAVGFADGDARVYQVTSQKLLTDVNVMGGATVAADRKPVHAIALAPKDDGLIALTPDSAYRARLDPGHPETTPASLFGKVWYEGYAKREYVWQSSSGTDDFEAKLVLVPLIFGTLKATIYSLLFGVPIALLAAVFTSEFLNPRVKSTVKPMVEMMASLPSVVLGFMAAIVLAPLVEKSLGVVLVALLTVPFALLLLSFIWQMLPSNITLRFERWRLPIALVALPIGVWLAMALSPRVESWFFGGNLRLWLDYAPTPGKPEADNPYHDPVGGWLVMLVPMAAVLTAALTATYLNPLLRQWTNAWPRHRMAAAECGKFLVGTGVALVAAWLVAKALALLGLDPRGGFIDTYVQRNALIVGFVMGFAVIPIIYTLAEDALSSVPNHLRSASLGAGATPWQTTVRIIIPTAMSGIFSAVMVGVGRAVGETMIVLMAAGNTPVLEWNIFSGFRTLSANIAVELPEAVRDGTHYRTLFLAALVLFAMTFALNTAAEFVRMRFRKRAFQL